MDLKTAQLYCQTNAYKWRVEKTKRFIVESLAKVERPYVSCSFGKDSSVMLHLVLQYRNTMPVLFVEYPETLLMDNYDAIINEWGIEVERIMIDSVIEDEINEKDILPKIANEMGLDAAFVGLRIEESVGRRISIKKHGSFAVFSGGARVCPLADWRLNDVATYCLVNNLPLLDTYKRFGFFDRTTTGLSGTEYGFREAQLARIRQTDLPRFNAILQKYPQLAKYC